MNVMSAYKVKIQHYNDIFNDSVAIYRKATRFFINICDKEWEELKDLSNKKRLTFIESVSLISPARKTVKYDFGKDFSTFPFYYRRAAINAAVGCYSSYMTHLAKWESGDKKDNPPKLAYNRNLMPTLYKKYSFKRTSRTTAKIKILHMGEWKWLDVGLREKDVKYIEKNCADLKECVPTLLKSGKQWYLSFPFRQSVELNETPVLEQTICAVDLGINNNAVCSIMISRGTILERKFINLTAEKDLMGKALGRVKKAQQGGSQKVPVKWKHVTHINADISKKTAQGILEFALQHNADVIVFEHLEFKGKIKGEKRLERHLWCKGKIQRIVKHRAHRNGLHFSNVHAKNTSSLAFDGSGYVKRDSKNNSLCTFSSGKRYNCDLSASYNIGARYFIREMLKSEPKLSALSDEEKYSRYGYVRTRTLSTLLKLNADMVG